MGNGLKDALRTAYGLGPLQESVDQTIRELEEIRINPNAAPPRLQERDFALIGKWCELNLSAQLSARKNAGIDLLEESIGASDLARLLSARAAELFALSRYASLDGVPVDVSVTQIYESGGDWLTHDIVALGKPIDVKNARRSRPNGRGYARHTAKFKRNRRDLNELVVLAGVLSDALRVEDYRLGRRGQACWLGETHLQSIRDLTSYLASNFEDVIDPHSLIPNCLGHWALIPGWMFEYPREQYCSREAAVSRIPILLREAHSKLYRLPHFLAAHVVNGDLVARYLDDDVDRDIWMALRGLRNAIGITRPSLYYTLLGLALRESLRPRPLFHPRRFARWVFREGALDRPMGLLDPQHYVSELVSALSKIWDSGANRLLTRFMHYRLSAPGIVRGVLPTGKELTILAYCGGYIPTSRRPCGRNPLYLGDSKHCAACGRLICADCGFCSAACGSG